MPDECLQSTLLDAQRVDDALPDLQLAGVHVIAGELGGDRSRASNLAIHLSSAGEQVMQAVAR